MSTMLYPRLVKSYHLLTNLLLICLLLCFLFFIISGETFVRIWEPCMGFILHPPIENIQRRATHMIPTVRHHSYPDRLNLLSLSYQRKHSDMISLYQIFQGHIDINIFGFFTLASYLYTREHSKKLFKFRFICCA